MASISLIASACYLKDNGYLMYDPDIYIGGYNLYIHTLLGLPYHKAAVTLMLVNNLINCPRSSPQEDKSCRVFFDATKLDKQDEIYGHLVANFEPDEISPHPDDDATGQIIFSNVDGQFMVRCERTMKAEMDVPHSEKLSCDEAKMMILALLNDAHKPYGE